MTSSRSYGDKLRIARERAGIDVVSMSRRLHIRPDILKAIETADFNRMPARGYSRNMIRAYARQLGLDEIEISEMYLDEVHLHESGMPRSSRRSYERESGYRNSRFSRDVAEGYGEYGADDRNSDDRYRSSIRSRNSSRISYGRVPTRYSYPEDDHAQEQDSRRSSVRFSSEPRRTSRRFDSYPGYRASSSDISRSSSNGRRIDGSDHTSRRDGISSNSHSIRFSSNRRHNTSGARNRTNISDIVLNEDNYSYSNVYGNDSKRRIIPSLNLPLLILIIAIAIALIIGVVVLFNSGTKSVDEVPNIPISGLSDTSDPEPDLTQVVTTSEPTSAKFAYSIESGARSWIEITENGSSKPLVNGVVEGPKTEVFDVTGTLTFKTANPTPLKVTVDGDEVKLSKSSNSDYYTYTVDFSAVLAAWKAENQEPGIADANDGAKDSSSSSANTSNSSSNRASSSSSSRSYSSSNR